MKKTSAAVELMRQVIGGFVGDCLMLRTRTAPSGIPGKHLGLVGSMISRVSLEVLQTLWSTSVVLLKLQSLVRSGHVRVLISVLRNEMYS